MPSSDLYHRLCADLSMSSLQRFWKRDRHAQHNPQTQSPLFTLPAELRLQIFDLVLNCSVIWLSLCEAWEGPYLELDEGGNGVMPLRATTIYASRLLSLLLSCSRAHDEALPLLYSHNTFVVSDSRTLQFLARGVGAPYITRLEVLLTQAFQLPLGPSSCSHTPWIRWPWKKHLKIRKWARRWESVKKLESLQYLFIELQASSVFWQETLRPFESVIIKPLEGLLKDGTVGKLRLFWDRPIGHEIAAEEVLDAWAIERVVEENCPLRRRLAERHSRQ
ncbi:hypothetical protein F5B22DRAFT_273620 [Xylaria bambusicola]|uniref:uncharacterized protein n=1 Tax=Xylaria bambusicola TaxID=326684 RepID=UPI002007809E|nr:uncharacterized protein F5B22DRAFT_273620 [Xylaria bambusicola]KAI0513128.1 hypothetical protein F5B22DRAFT_273620 [Xylaria bambusicola]